MPVKNQILKLLAFAKRHPVISAETYLFGWHASGHKQARSDLDLGALFHKHVDGFTKINLETE